MSPPGKLLWCLLVPVNESTEGPWGKNSAQERNGTGTGGSSGACLKVNKVPDLFCPYYGQP